MTKWVNHFPTKQETAFPMKGDIMGNDMVGQAIEAMKQFRPNKTVMKIWEKGKICLILAAKDPDNWQMEMDPYYIFADGKVDGVSFIDNATKLKRIARPEKLIYHNKDIA